MMTFTVIIADDDGLSHFVDQDFECPSEKRTILLTIQSQGAWDLSQSTPGHFSDYHTTLQPRLLIVLQGTLEIGVSDDDIRQFHAGDMIHARDTTGKGHTSAAVGVESCRVLSAVWDPSVE